MNINISNEFNFPDVHGALNHSGSLAKLTRSTSGFIHFARDPLWFKAPEHQKNEIHFLNEKLQYQSSNIRKTCPQLAINRYFLALKIENFQLKNFDIFLIFAPTIGCKYSSEPPRPNIDCVYTLEPPW